MPSAPPVLSSFRFDERGDHEKGFSAYYDEKIKPGLKELEQEKQLKLAESEKIKPRAKLIFIAGIILGIGLTIYTGNGAFLFITMVAWGIKHAMIGAPISAFAENYKQKIVPLTINFFGNFEYRPAFDPPVEALAKTGIFDSFNRSYAEDYIAGNYKDIPFKFMELNLDYHSGGRHSSTRTVFEGMIIITEFKRTLAGQIIIKRENQKGLWSWLTGKSRGLKNYKVGDGDFESIFEAYSSDEAEAAVLLTPALIQRLKEINFKYPQGSVRCSFLGNQMLLAISHNRKTQNYFENMDPKDPQSSMENIHRYLDQMKEILNIVETVNAALT